MTADELRKIVDRFHVALEDADKWACDRISPGGTRTEWSIDLHAIWCDLSRACALMKDGERRKAVKP